MFNSDLPADSSKIRYSAGYIRDNFKVIEAVLGADVLSAGTKFNVFDSGTQLWFYQATAPTGWTILTTLSDCLLGVVNTTTGNTYSTAGQVDGSWQQSDHTLSEGEMPRHSHDIYPISTNLNPPGNAIGFQGQNIVNTVYQTYATDNRKSITQTTGDSQGHNHGNTWRPAAAVGIIAVKN